MWGTFENANNNGSEEYHMVQNTKFDIKYKIWYKCRNRPELFYETAKIKYIL